MLFGMIMLGLLVVGAWANGRKEAFEEIEREVIHFEIGEMEKFRLNQKKTNKFEFDEWDVLRGDLKKQNKINDQVRRITGITR